MKRLSLFIAVLFSGLMLFSFTPVVDAQSCTSSTQCTGGKVCTSGTCQSPSSGSTSGGTKSTGSTSSGGKFGQGFLGQTNLISGTPSTLIVNVINAVTAVLGVVLIAMLVYGGALYLTSTGSEDRVKSAKSTITYAIIGMVVIAAARIIAQFVISALGG